MDNQNENQLNIQKEVFRISNFSEKYHNHHAQVAVLSCIDHRFRQADQDFIVKNFGDTFDHLKWPGAAKNFREELMSDRLIQIFANVCKALHGVSTIVLLNHADCGGYGGTEKMGGTEKEIETYMADLQHAVNILTDKFPEFNFVIAWSRMDGDDLVYDMARVSY